MVLKPGSFTFYSQKIKAVKLPFRGEYVPVSDKAYCWLPLTSVMVPSVPL